MKVRKIRTFRYQAKEMAICGEAPTCNESRCFHQMPHLFHKCREKARLCKHVKECDIIILKKEKK